MSIFNIFKKKEKGPREILPTPKSYTQEVLLHLILHRQVSIVDFPILSGFRARIANIKLDHGLPLDSERVVIKSKYGNKSHYTNHILLADHVDRAIEVYIKLSKTE